MKRLLLTTFAAAALAAPGSLGAQAWVPTETTVGVRGTISEMRQFSAGTRVNLSFGTEGIEPGVTKTVAPEDDDPVTGVGGKVEVRFNVGTKISVIGTHLTATIGDVTYSIPATFACAVASDRSGTLKTSFSTSCTDGYEFTREMVTGMTTRVVLVGATIDARDSDSLPAGTYTGTVTVELTTSGS